MDQTLYEALEGELRKHSLTYTDIERVAVKHQGRTQLLKRGEAKNLLQQGRLLECHGTSEPDNIPFFAYTANRIFFISHGDEFPDYWIESIPRNPTDREEPTHLPREQ